MLLHWKRPHGLWRNQTGYQMGKHITSGYIYVMMSLYPLFTGVQGYKNLTYSKFMFFSVVTVSWLISIAVCRIYDYRKGNGAWHMVQSMGRVHWCIAAFFLVAILSSFVSPYKSAVLLGAGRYDGLWTITLYVVTFFLISMLGEIKYAHLGVFAVSICICCGIAIVQLAGYNPFSLFPGDYTYYDGQIRYTGEFLGTIGNTNLLSGVLSLSIPLFGAMFILGKRHSDLWWLVAAGLQLFVLVSSRVAGGMVALLITALVIPPLLITNRQRMVRMLLAGGVFLLAIFGATAYTVTVPDVQTKVHITWQITSMSLMLISLALAAFGMALFLWRRRNDPFISPTKLKGWLLGLSIAASIMGLGLIYIWPSPHGVIAELKAVLHGEVQEEFGSSRIRIWKEALRLYPVRPLLGGGPDTLALRMHVQFERLIPETGKMMRTFVDNAHNEYIAHLINLGAAGLMTYLAAIGATIHTIVTPLKTREKTDALFLALGCSIFAYWIQGFFGLGLCIVAPFAWILWGLLLGSLSIRHVDCVLKDWPPHG